MAKTPAGKSAAPQKTAAPKKPAAKPKTPKAKVTPGAPALAPAAALARINTRSKFTLFNLLGQPRGYYLVEPVELERDESAGSAKSVAHSVIVVDRSGSMYSDLAATKETLLKILTLDEYAQYNLLVTLISYSSVGDVTCHFERVPIREIMKKDSKYQKDIKSIRTSCATCISQGLRMASEKVKAGELTAITIHTDGYANDPSSNSEATALIKLCDDMSGKDVFVNTLAYGNYTDFRLLSRVANAGSGSCIKAGDIGAVYSSLYNSTKTLGSSVTPPIEVPLGEYDYQVFISRGAGRANGSAGTLSIRGLKSEDDAIVYKYRKLTKAEYDKLDVPVEQTSEAVFAFAKGNLAEGNLNTAKYALGSTFDATLVGAHARALTNNQVAAMAQDIDALMLSDPGQLSAHTVLDQVPVNKKIPFLVLINLLDANRGNFVINRQALQEVYVRRGLKRIPGVRNDDGTVTEPTLKTEFVNEDTYLPISSFDVNRNTATMNMMLTRKVRLVPAAGGAPITEVAGIKLDSLSTFNNYTLVGDGELTVPFLKVKISDKSLFDKLMNEGVLELDGAPTTKYDKDQEYTLRLDQLPIVPPFEGSVELGGVFDDLAKLKVLSSLCGAHLKEEAADLTPEQVEELKKHYLSKSLFLNFPTTNPYVKLEDALSDGSVDTRTSYKIDVGSKHILNLSKLHSANKFLDRMYEVVGADGKPMDKPAFEDVLDGNVTYKHKTLSAKTKVTKVDDFMKALFDDFLGLRPNGAVVKILEGVGADKLAAIVKDRAKGKQPGRKEFVEALADARKKLDARSDALFAEKLSALVFYVGATGLLPDEVEAKAQSADVLAGKYPDLAFSKDEKEGTFFEVGDTILSVYAKTEYFSRDK
ncbi:von Willebrand factor type A domain protein [Gemmata sp. SH-PL17]|uniref:VWA domain-containing protein n=1 Tax=Gemmata sp. SH-PL17 TaxID=1630693 RepID=UPI00078D42E5|nr:VWA domain-containing protein [Gemmata sp. SH-PL17]AMV23174.1 von Willebrand factor type A domain protein [Gemmata sp. SH-PL17]